MILRSLLFSFEGRISRKTYWLTLLGYFGAIAAVAVAFRLSNDYFLLIPRWDDARPYFYAGLVAAMLPLLPITIKRLQDRDRSWLALCAVTGAGYAVLWGERLVEHLILGDPLFRTNQPSEWLQFLGAAPLVALTHTMPPMGAFTVFGTIPKLVNAIPDGLLSPAVMFYSIDIALGLLAMIAGLWFFWQVGLRRGTVGPNRYGPDPLG